MNDSIGSRHPCDMSHIELSYITMFYCNQVRIDTVVDLLRKYERYPENLLKRIEFVIVDDGSPLQYEIPRLALNITWLRIQEDIRWNQSGARNLGATYAKSDKMILTDIDHEFPPETLQYLLGMRNPGRNFYKFFRMDVRTEVPIRTHANTFFLSRARFMRHFGVDEEYAGNYGGEDHRFVKYHKYHGSRLRYLPRRYFIWRRMVDADNSYHSLKRDSFHNLALDKRKQRESAQRGGEYGHSRIFLNFTWKVVRRNRLEPPPPPYRPWWRPLWRLRYLSSFLAR